MVEVSGVLLNSFYAAGESIRLLLQQHLARHSEWAPEQWYDVAQLHSLMARTSNYNNPGAVLERLGEEMMIGWYAQGPGRELAPTALEFIRFQASSQGYRTVVRGAHAEIGEFRLTALDEAAGTATVCSSTIFHRKMELGILYGGLQSCADLLYFDITQREDQCTFDLRFVSSQNRTSITWAAPASESEWRLQQRLHQLERRELFWVSINDTLHEAMTELGTAQQQLFLSEKMASLGTLTAGVAHEINNPTNFAHAGAQALETELENFRHFLVQLAGEDSDPAILASLNGRIDNLVGQVDTILEGTSRIRNLVRDLRTFTRLDEADKKSIRLGDSLQSTINLVKTQFANTATIVCRLDADPILECWPAQLNQVFMNLIVNACQAIERKQRANGTHLLGRLDITSRSDGQQLVLSFKDNGCGIPDAIVARIFEPFFTTNAIGEGSGLGLSISYGIINKHGGTLTVTAHGTEGSCFEISLPLNAAS